MSCLKCARERVQGCQSRLDPLQIPLLADMHYDWKCACGHTFNATCLSVHRDHWCHYCSGQKLCGSTTCLPCFNRSLASSSRMAEFLDANPDLNPFMIPISSNLKYDWLCECGHTFRASCGNVKRGHWCPYCGPITKKLCGDNNCLHCFHRSIASSPHAKEFLDANPNTNPLLIPMWSEKKVPWQCTCGHTFEAPCSKISSGRWCPYCAIPRQRLCGDPFCFDCFNSSVASSKRVQEFMAANPSIDPLMIPISSSRKLN